jgi:GH15 family glucan-1,4-alpha-glucosidase
MMEEILSAETEQDLLESLKYLEWVKNHASPSGVLAEQVNPFNGRPLSVAPLTWSHATVVEVVMMYLRRVRELRAKRGVVYRLHKPSKEFSD